MRELKTSEGICPMMHAHGGFQSRIHVNRRGHLKYLVKFVQASSQSPCTRWAFAPTNHGKNWGQNTGSQPIKRLLLSPYGNESMKFSIDSDIGESLLYNEFIQFE